MLREHENDGKNEREHLMHAPEEEFDDSQTPSVFGTFRRSNGDTSAENQLFMHRADDEETLDPDDQVKRPLFLSFKANDSAQSVSEALREQNDMDASMMDEDLLDPFLSDEMITDPTASADQFAEPNSEPEDKSAFAGPKYGFNAPDPTAKPSMLDTMYAKEDYWSKKPKYEIDNSLEDEIEAELGSENFSPFQPFAAFKPAVQQEEPKQETPVVPEPVAQPEPVVEEPVVEEPVVSEAVEQIAEPEVPEAEPASEPVSAVQPVAFPSIEVETPAGMPRFESAAEAEPVAESTEIEQPAEEAEAEHSVVEEVISEAPVTEEAVSEEVAEQVEEVAAPIEEAASEIEENAEETVEAVEETVEATVEETVDAAEETVETVEDVVEEQIPSTVSETEAASMIEEVPAFARTEIEPPETSEDDISVLEASPIINVASMIEPEDEVEEVSEAVEEAAEAVEESVVEEPSVSESVSEPAAEETVVSESADEAVSEEAVVSEPEANEVDTSSIYDNAPIEDPSADMAEGYESIYTESDATDTAPVNYSAPEVHPHVSIASANLDPIDSVYASPVNAKRLAANEEHNAAKAANSAKNHLLFGDGDENEFHEAAMKEIEQNKIEKEKAAAAAAAAATAVAAEPSRSASSGLRPGSSLGNKAETAASEASAESRPAATARSSQQRPGGAINRPVARPEMSSSAQLAAKSQRHSYNAASQRGSITPVEQQEHTTEKKRSIVKPIICICAALICLGGLIFCWQYFELGKVFSASKDNSEATTYSEKETESESKETKVITVSSDSETEKTSEDVTTTTTEEPTTTTTEEPTTTTTEEPTTTTTEEPTTTTTEKPTTTTTEAPATTSEPKETVAPSEYKKTSFTTKITNAKASGKNCSFDIKFTNNQKKTSSLNASLEYVTITFSETSATITSIECTNFTVVAKEGSKNTFYLYPNSDEALEKGDTIVASITAEGDKSIGSFKIKNFLVQYLK